MLIRTYTCDTCGKDISDSQQDVKHRLSLAADYILRRHDLSIDRPLPLLDREYHFCGMKCLDQWMVKSGEKI